MPSCISGPQVTFLGTSLAKNSLVFYSQAKRCTTEAYTPLTFSVSCFLPDVTSDMIVLK